MSPRYRARKTLRIGPYFRHYAASAGQGRGRAGFTSHGFRFRIPLVGTITHNLTTGVTTWDNPGPGSVTFGNRRSNR